MDSLNLHEITNVFEAMVNAAIDQETGEIDPELEDQLEQLTGERKEKVLNCARVANSKAAMAKAIAVQIATLQQRKRVHEAGVTWLKTWISNACNLDEKFETADIKVSFRKSTRAIAHDIEAVPAELVTIKPQPEPTLDANAAKKWATAHNGESPAGVTITTHKSVQIK